MDFHLDEDEKALLALVYETVILELRVAHGIATTQDVRDAVAEALFQSVASGDRNAFLLQQRGINAGLAYGRMTAPLSR
jgi:hypothetical protein